MLQKMCIRDRFSYVADETGKAVTDASTVKVGDPLTVLIMF